MIRTTDLCIIRQSYSDKYFKYNSTRIINNK